ncbi:MAG: HAD-IA family hydrolase [Gemmobacter sp.]
MRTVIFDLDGTLAETSGDLLHAANAVFAAEGHGAPLTAADARTAMTGGRAMLRLGSDRLGLGWGDADLTLRYAALVDVYADAIAVHTRLYPGAAAAVERLRAGGTAVGICTNKPAFLAERLMSALGVRALFASLVGGDTLAVRKPDPAPLRLALAQAGGPDARGIMVGDTLTDRAAARNAGIPAVLVTFGAEAGAVAGHAPEALIDHFDDLDAALARLWP